MRDGADVAGLLEAGKVVQIKPQGFSMYPMFIPGRDAAVLAKADRSGLKRGDVVLYRRDTGILVLHRIWKVTRDGVYLIGDNQSCIEGPIRKEQVLGILVSFLHDGRMISVRNPLYWLAARGWLILRPVRDIIKRTAAALLKGGNSR